MTKDNKNKIDLIELEFGEEIITVPVKSGKETKDLERRIQEACEPFLSKIPQMTGRELVEFQFNQFQAFDLERQLVPGQRPKYWFNHSENFEEWENQIFSAIEARKKALGDLYEIAMENYLNEIM